MSKRAAQIIREDFDEESKKAQKLGYSLVFRHYLQNLNISRQHVRNWDDGVQISVAVARRIEEKTGGRLRVMDLLGAGANERREDTDGTRANQIHDLPL